jgi:glycine/D-amino acid oxidase-like deaminating enzyme
VPDVVVVGGGIIGAACADELTRRGASVTVIERDELASGASGRNQGLWVPPEDPALREISTRSLARYLLVPDEAPLPVWIDAQPFGTVYVAGDAGALTVGLALLASARGATIRHHLSVRALRRSGDRVTGVVTDEGVVDADEVIVAAGPWSPRLLDPLGIRLSVVGVRGWIVRIDPGGPLVRHLVRTVESVPTATERPTAREVARDGMPISEDYGSIVHPHIDGTVLVGSSRAAWLTPEPEDPDVPRMILAEAIRVVPRIADASVVSSWWGLRPMTPDGRPLIGRVRDGLIVATGHGSEGVINGAGTAQLVASFVAGEEPPFDEAPFDPFRFG